MEGHLAKSFECWAGLLLVSDALFSEIKLLADEVCTQVTFAPGWSV